MALPNRSFLEVMYLLKDLLSSVQSVLNNCIDDAQPEEGQPRMKLYDCAVVP